MNDLLILKTFNDLTVKLNATPGTNAKLELLKQYEELRPLIKRIWDPDTKTGVTKKSIEDFASKKADEAETKGTLAASLYELFDNLTSRRWTGDKAKAGVVLYARRYPEYTDLIYRIAEKKPRIRMNATLLLRAFPGMFKVFKVALSEEYNEVEFAKELKAADGVAFMSKKIDGVRLITIVKGDRVQFYSRTGREWTSLDNLKRDFIDNVVPEMKLEEISAGMVFDGELVALDENGNENFKETVSQARKKEIQMTNPRYQLFDVIPLKAFEGETTSPVLEDRIKLLEDIFLDARPRHCTVLEQRYYSEKSFREFTDEAREKGWEGIMIRFNRTYEAKRTKRLQKYKFFQTEEFKVESATLEDMPFPNATGGETVKKALKNVTILYKGGEVSVGSGFSTEERLEFAKDPTRIVGKLISVQFQEPFQDKKTGKWSLRCPIFKLLIGDEREF